MDPIERRAVVLAAAADVFAEKGYFATGVADIVDRARIARGTFYLYFKNKRQAFLEVMAHITAELSARFRPINLDARALPLVEQFRENLRDVIRFFQDNPNLGRILLHHAASVDADSEEHFGVGTRMLESVVRGHLEEGQRVGVLRPFNTDAAACLIVGGIRELVTQSVMYGNVRVSLDEMVETIVQMNCFGILKREVSLG